MQKIIAISRTFLLVGYERREQQTASERERERGRERGREREIEREKRNKVQINRKLELKV